MTCRYSKELCQQTRSPQMKKRKSTQFVFTLNIIKSYKVYFFQTIFRSPSVIGSNMPTWSFQSLFNLLLFLSHSLQHFLMTLKTSRFSNPTSVCSWCSTAKDTEIKKNKSFLNEMNLHQFTLLKNIQLKYTNIQIFDNCELCKI